MKLRIETINGSRVAIRMPPKPARIAFVVCHGAGWTGPRFARGKRFEGLADRTALDDVLFIWPSANSPDADGDGEHAWSMPPKPEGQTDLRTLRACVDRARGVPTVTKVILGGNSSGGAMTWWVRGVVPDLADMFVPCNVPNWWRAEKHPKLRAAVPTWHELALHDGHFHDQEGNLQQAVQWLKDVNGCTWVSKPRNRMPNVTEYRGVGGVPFVCAIGDNWGHGWRNRTKWATHEKAVVWGRELWGMGG